MPRTALTSRLPLASTLIALLVVLVPLAQASRAGVLELPFDEVSTDRHCDVDPCRDNGFVYKRVFFRDRYLRFDIHVAPAQYVMRKIRVMVAPPAIAPRTDYESERYGDLSLVELPTGPYRRLGPAQYETVVAPVLVHPERSYVTRRQPHYAYYPEWISVLGF
jgi:hypothetical protein